MSIYHSVLILIGNDIGPIFFTMQIIFVAVCITFGAIGNADIFGKLVVLVSVLNANTSEFVTKLVICNTAMTNLKLSKYLRSEGAWYLTYTLAILSSQQKLETFKSMISPSLKEKFIKEIFSDAPSKAKIFALRELLIDRLTRMFQTKIFQPDKIMINKSERW